jgi:vancomycin resistance protein YoaR
LDTDSPSVPDPGGDVAPDAAVSAVQGTGLVAVGDAVVGIVPDSALVAGPRRRGRRALAFLVAFVVGLAAVVGVAGGALAAWDGGYAERILPGVHAAGVDLSGMSRAQASAALAAALPWDRGRIVLRSASDDRVVTYAAVGRHADIDALVDAALRSGRDGSTLSRAVAEVGQALHGTSIDPVVRLDEGAVASAITAALAPLEMAPVPASVSVVGGVPVASPAHAGLHVDPAPAIAAALEALRTPAAPAELVVPVATSPVPPALSDADAQAAIAASQRMIAPVTARYGKLRWTIAAKTVANWVGFANGASSILPVVDPSLVAKSLGAVAKGVALNAVSATYLRSKAGKIVGVAASGNGRSLDSDTTVNGILAELASRLTGGKPAAVGVATLPIAPQFTTAQAQAKAPVMSLLGKWTTWFPINDHNFFGANIWIPAQIIDGTVLAPGQTFDWWNTVGVVSPAGGYGPGGFIAGNHTEPTGALGGGMCSSSTTLFNAALRAGLRMGQRGNHLYYINRYPLGLDATVWKTGGAVQDMSFTNDTNGPLLIRGLRTRSGSTGYVTYQIWGVPDGRKVSLSSPIVSNVVQATTITATVTTLAHGVRKQTEWPSNQMDTSVTRVVRNAAGQVIHQEVWQSHYTLWNGLIQVGL